MSKVCKTCGVEKGESEFYLDKQTGSRKTTCKSCEIARYKEWRSNNREKDRQHKVAWVARNKVRVQRQKAEYARIHPKAYNAAHGAVNTARRNGAASASMFVCIACGNTAKDWHHWSYLAEHRLSVIPLCTACHQQHHAGTLPVVIGPWYAVELRAPVNV